MAEKTEHNKSDRFVGRLIWVFVVAMLLLLFLFAWHLHLDRRITAAHDGIRQAGFPVTLDELAELYPPIPSHENAAELYLDAFSRLRNWPDERLADLPMVGDADLPLPTEPLPPEMAGCIAEYLADNADSLKLLYAASERAACRYPVEFNLGLDARLDHLSSIRQGIRLLTLETLSNIESSRPDLAVESILCSLALSDSLSNEPSLVSHLVKITCLAVTAYSLEYLLNRALLADRQLVELSAVFVELAQYDGLCRVIAGERCFGLNCFTTLSRLSHGHRDVSNLFMLGYRGLGLWHLDYLDYLECAGAYFQAFRLGYPNRIAAARDVDDMVAGLPKWLFNTRDIASFGSLTIQDAISTAHLRNCIAALAVERYRLAAGSLPSSLEELVPRFLEAVPQDPFDGAALRYRRIDDGFVVYSIGEDGTDDNGVKDYMPCGFTPDVSFAVRAQSVYNKLPEYPPIPPGMMPGMMPPPVVSPNTPADVPLDPP